MHTTTLKLSGDTQRCWWCGRETHGSEHPVQIHFRKEDYDLQVCSRECETSVMGAYRYIQKVGPFFLTGMAAALILIVAGGPILSAAGLFVGGITLVICPFTTPQTTQMIGLKKSMSIARVAGILLSIGALIIILVAS